MGLQALLRKAINRAFEHSNVFVLSTGEGGIGNTAEEIHKALIYARRTGKKLLVLRRYPVLGISLRSNKEIYDLEGPYFVQRGRRVLQVIGNLLLTLLFGHISAAFNYLRINLSRLFQFLKAGAAYVLSGGKTPKPKFQYRHFRHLFSTVYLGLERLWNPFGEKEFSWKAAESLDWRAERRKPLNVELAPEKKAWAEGQLRKMGIGANDWFVAVHVREGGFHGDLDNPRNGNIMDCVPALKAITEAGGWVVRMGDSTMTRLPVADRVIDYPFTEFKSALLDLYLIQKCAIFVGLNSGLLDVAHLFQKQTVLLGCTEFILSPYPRQHSLALTKHIFSKKLNRFLSIREQLTQPFSMHQMFGVDENYAFENNTPEEIREIVLESLEMMRNPNYQYSTLQNTFIEKRTEMIRRYCEQEDLPFVEDEVFGIDFKSLGKWRFASQTLGAEGTLGRAFLERNWEKHQTSKSRF